MDYMKHILQREGIQLGKAQTFVDIYEKLSNQQDLQKIGKQILSTLKIKGNVSLIRYNENRFYIVESIGKSEEILHAFEDKTALKEVRLTKTMYQTEDTSSSYHITLPILSKNDEFLGALCIHDKQTITCWKEIHILLHLMAFVYKYYDMINAHKFSNIKDAVTTLYNFKHFQNHLDIEIEKTTRYNIPLTIVLVNIKDFRMINEKLGHEAGDEVLHQVGTWIESNSRKVDMPARMEGDTFAILLSNTPVEGAQVYLNRLLNKIYNNNVSAMNKEFKINVRTSILGYENHFTRQEFLDLAKTGLKLQKRP